MKASADNVFVGAILTKDNEKFLVVKVNAKSMYVAKGMTLEEYNRRYSLKVKGVTFKDFCKTNNIEMVKFDNFEIEESEAAKKTVVEETKSSAKNVPSAFGKAEKMVLTELLKYNKIQRLANIGVGDNIIRVMENKDNNRFLLNVNNDYILWNKELDSSYFVCHLLDYKPGETTFPWEKITPKKPSIEGKV
jgi:hypothetical protein